MSTDHDNAMAGTYHNVLQQVEDALDAEGFETGSYRLPGEVSPLLARPGEAGYKREHTLQFNFNGLSHTVYEEAYDQSITSPDEFLYLHLRSQTGEEEPVIGAIDIEAWPDEGRLPAPIQVEYRLNRDGGYLAIDDTNIAASHRETTGYTEHREHLSETVGGLITALEHDYDDPAQEPAAYHPGSVQQGAADD